jgi:hypothetical protein
MAGQSGRGDGSPQALKPAPIARPEITRTGRSMSQTTIPGGPSLDIRA